jgi:ABC-type nickel/cobalt efflux system permease component RcnA
VATALPGITMVAQTIQLAVAPVFLLAGIGAFLNVTAGRLARVVDRARVVEGLVLTTRGREHDRHIREITRLDQRMTIINWSIGLSVGSAMAVALLVILLFAAELTAWKLGGVVAVLFILAMLLIAAGLSAFLVEVRLAASNIRIRSEILNHEADEG